MGISQSSYKDFGSSLSRRSTAGSLPQTRTNGKSVLGTLAAPLLPMFLTNNPLPNGFPWSKFTEQTNYYQQHPNTGVIRPYEFNISRGIVAPDGYERSVLLVNDRFPGPTINANWGDTIQVTVHNNIDGPEEGVAIHWHGLTQKGTPWEDGVPAVTQCPIPPGKSFTYSFIADLYGSSWYHSHYSAQYAGGLSGAMVIHGPTKEKYDYDLGPILLSDWYHKEYFELIEEMLTPGGIGIFTSQSNLINGKMNYDCSTLRGGDAARCHGKAGISKFRFHKNKTHRLRLINNGAEALQRFSIDGHVMRVIANDFVEVEPYDTKVVTLGIGQRADVLVKANGKLDAYWMRSNISQRCSLADNPNAVAAVYYDRADTNKEPTSQPWDIPDPETCENDALDKTNPVMKLDLPKPDKTFTMDVVSFVNDSGVNQWMFGGVDFRGNYNSPTLLLSNLGNHSFEEQWNVRDTGRSKSVRVIVNNKSGASHPMHLHGFNMYILSAGPGEWDGTITRSRNPQRRDVQQLPGNGHLVMQFDAAENPGVWPFHCHIAWHVSGGLFTQFMTKPDAIERYRIPKVVADTCRQWGKYTKTNIPLQIDSGL